MVLRPSTQMQSSRFLTERTGTDFKSEPRGHFTVLKLTNQASEQNTHIRKHTCLRQLAVNPRRILNKILRPLMTD